MQEIELLRAEQSRAEQLDYVHVIGQMDNTIDHTFESANRVYDYNGIAPTVNTCGGGGLQPKVIDVKKINYVNMPQTVRVRKYEIDKMVLCDLLRKHKSEKKLNNKQISKELNVAKTEVEHWFRRDESFSIPREDVWFSLKELLGIKTNKFDEAIMTFEERNGVFEKSERVYLPDSIAPTITTESCNEKVVECRCLGGFGEKKSNGGTQWYQQDRVYSMGDVALCQPANIPSGSYNYLEVKKMDKQIVAMRGRGDNNEQQLELNNSCCTNTITSVQKDNLLLEKSVIAIDEQNNATRTETFGCLTTDGSSPKHNNRVGEIAKVKIREANKKGYAECEIGGVADLNYVSSNTRRGRVQSGGAISPTLCAENVPSVIELGDPDFYNFLYEIDGDIYLIRIRKLTPKECWRLMDFEDEDFEKAKYKNEKLYLEGGVEKCNAKLKVVAENQRQLNTETYVLCTTKDLQDMEILKTIAKKSAEMQENEKTVNVSIVTEKSEDMEHLGCATNIIKCGAFMGMHFSLMEEKDQNHMVISVQVKMGNTNTEKCMKIITESNLTEVKLYTILTLIKQITESKIFSASTVQANIEGVIQIMTDCEGNILTQLSSLRMEHITELSSNTVLYKQAGNSIVVNCLVGIFGQMFEGKEEMYKQV